MSSERVSIRPAASLPLNKGHYIATSMSNNLQVAFDSFVVHEADDGVVVESKHRIFGGNLPVQNASFTLDSDWTPRRLDVSAEEMVTTVEFGDAESSISVRTAKGEQRMSFPVGRRRAYLLISGGLYFPMHIVRRFRFEDPASQLFDLVPTGICEVHRIEDLHEDGETFRQLEMRLQVGGIEDLLHLTVNQRGDLVRYRTRNQNLLAKLDDRE